MLREDPAVSTIQWGWDGYFEAVWSDRDRESTVPARVVAQHRGCWRVAGDFGERTAEAAGKLRLAAEEGADWPAVGDWAAVELDTARSEEHTSELQSRVDLVCRL